MSWYEGLKAGAAPKDAKDDTHYQWDFCQQRRKVLATQCLAEPKLYTYIPNAINAEKKLLIRARVSVKDPRYVFHFRPKPNIWPGKTSGLRLNTETKAECSNICKNRGDFAYLANSLIFFCHVGAFFLRIVIEFSR